MQFTRRETIKLGLTGITAATILPLAARAEAAGDSYATDHGEIRIIPVQHASFVLVTPDLVIVNDPVGKDKFAGNPPAGLILVTHEHPDHFDPEALAEITGADTRLVVNHSVMDKLPAELKAKATALKNGESTTVGAVKIDAIPAYNTTEERKQYHPQGRDNGYVLTIDGKRVYIAGDTEDIPEMRALKDIDIAFVPMNLPYTMTTDQAAAGVAAFKPQVVYPYHYKGTDPNDFAAKLAKAAPEVKVVLGKWYS